MAQFEPGTSGNPAGRPKEAGTLVADLKVLARARTMEAFQAILDVMDDPSAKPGIRLKAAEMILDRAWGKAAPAPAETPDNKPITTQLEVLSEAEAAAIRLKVNGEGP